METNLMENNYYLYQNICPHCDKADKKIHIGKLSWGWTFSFRGYKYPSGDREPDEDIVSYKDWLKYLNKWLRHHSVIRTEEGNDVSIGELKSLIRKASKNTMNHAARFKDHSDWLDESNHSFTGTEFS